MTPRWPQPVVHGSVSAAELAGFGLRPSDVLDFSVNTNPCGPPPGVLRAIRDTDWTRYPGDDEPPLRAAIARRNAVAEAQVALGNGSAELIWLICLAVLRPGDAVAVAEPTFGEYARAARVFSAPIVPAEDMRARLLFVCQPNNPTGSYRPQSEIECLLSEARSRIVVLDEAYVSFVDDGWSSGTLLERYPNLIVLRSMTKDHALPGLRLGYALAAADIARSMEAVRPPWSVNAGALRAGLAALEPKADAHLGRARELVRQSRQMLTDGFTRLGYRVEPSQSNFVLVDVGHGAALRTSLLPQGLVVRDCASFGLPSCIRVACRLTADCDRLLRAMANL